MTETVCGAAFRVGAPPRLEDILKALRRSGGDAIAVEDSDILKAAKTLNQRGVYAELTAAAAEVFNETYAYLWKVRRQKNG